MRKRRFYLLVIAVLALIGVLAAIFSPPPEPTYRGKRLGQWVTTYITNLQVESVDAAEKAADAIRHTGTNGVDWLVKWMRYEQPVRESKIHSAVNLVLEFVHPEWIGDHRSRADCAGIAFRVMGPEPEGVPDPAVLPRAIQQLTRLLNDPTAQAGAPRALYALASLGNPGLEPLLAYLTNYEGTVENDQRPGLRRKVVEQIGRFGTNAQSALPVLKQLVTDRDPEMRELVTNAVHQIDPKALKEARNRSTAKNAE